MRKGERNRKTKGLFDPDACRWPCAKKALMRDKMQSLGKWNKNAQKHEEMFVWFFGKKISRKAVFDRVLTDTVYSG